MAAIELGCPYYVWGGNNQFCLNNPADPNFVGYVTDITGLDDAEVRENAQNKVAGDGGLHGPFYKGRRPWTVTGFIMPQMPVSARSAAQDFISQVMDKTLKVDGFLTWYPTNGVARYVGFRKQQPLRITKGQSNVERTFQLAGVAADPLIYSSGPVHSADTALGSGLSLTVFNAGTTDSPPTITLYGANNFLVTNRTTGQALGAVPAFSFGQTVTITLSGNYPSVTTPVIGDSSGFMDITQTNWDFALAPGNNVVDVQNATRMIIQWRDAFS